MRYRDHLLLGLAGLTTALSLNVVYPARGKTNPSQDKPVVYLVESLLSKLGNSPISPECKERLISHFVPGIAVSFIYNPDSRRQMVRESTTGLYLATKLPIKDLKEKLREEYLSRLEKILNHLEIKNEDCGRNEVLDMIKKLREW